MALWGMNDLCYVCEEAASFGLTLCTETNFVVKVCVFCYTGH